MKIDLLHNKIIKDTVTDAFRESFESVLVPKLLEKYSDALLGVQMYEDYLGDGFVFEGSFYYPLTLVFADGARREWISWSIENKKRFVGGVPYAYIGDLPIEFELAESVPGGFSEKLSERGIYFEDGYVTFSLDSVSTDKTFLAGKYSQRFIDELNRQISRKIEKTFEVCGIADSGIELKMVFAPGTYMEHVLKDFTYRRLLITARACSARDLWIRWKRLTASTPVTISENAPEEELLFEICEDVPQKIREKEYRFLVSVSSDKYQAAMGRKRITEWRDLIKRVIKRGELKKLDAKPLEDENKSYAPLEIPKAEPVSEPDAAPKAVRDVSENDVELVARLQETLSAFSAPAPDPVPSEQETDNGDIAAMLKNLLGVTDDAAKETETAEAVLDEPELESVAVAEESIESITVTEESFDSFAEPDGMEEPADEQDSMLEIMDDPTAEEEPVIRENVDSEEELRRKIEAEIRAEVELEARLKAEAEAEELRRAHDALKAENERLAELARKAEEKRIANEAERIAEAEKLRGEIEARERAEEREKARMAEAARLAVIEQQRLAAERAEEEKRRLAEEAENERLAEAARIEEQRRLEAERIRAEMKAEEERAAKSALEAAAKEEKAQSANYVSKNARLLFRRPVDPNITKRIHEIILTTIKYFKKENVYIKIKATVPDSTTVNLHFVKIPEEETELLVNIIKVLGKSELGIIKAILE